MLLHHVELWVPDLTRAERSWGWLLTALGAEPFQEWSGGRSWRSGATYMKDHVLLTTRKLAASLGTWPDHVAFHVRDLDTLVREAPAHGWTLLFPDRHPWAGGADHRAAYLEDEAGFEVELVEELPSGA